MRVLITAGPTREYIDPVRFITNASSGRMGCAVAAAAGDAGHEVTLLLGAVVGAPDELGIPGAVTVVRFATAGDLKRNLEDRFDACDALIMAAAVGDFRPEEPSAQKLPRSGGPITLKLIPTEDIVATVAQRKRSDQIVITFAVEDPPPERAEAKAREEMASKNADYVVVNTPAAIGTPESLACILSGQALVLPWSTRPKHHLAAEIVKLLE